MATDFDSNSSLFASDKSLYDTAMSYGASLGKTPEQVIAAAQQGYNAHAARHGSGYTEGSSHIGILQDYIFPALGVPTPPQIAAARPQSDAQANARWQATQEDDGGFLGMGDLGTLAMLAAAVYTGGTALGAWGGLGAAGAGAGAGGLAELGFAGSSNFFTALGGVGGAGALGGAASLADLGLAGPETFFNAGNAASGAGAFGVGDGGASMDWFDDVDLTGFMDQSQNPGALWESGANWWDSPSLLSGDPLNVITAPATGISTIDAPGMAVNLAGGGMIPAEATSFLSTLSKYGNQALDLGKKLLSGSGDQSTLDQLLKLGVPAALVAGLFENNKSPLVGPMTDAARAAYESAGAFGALPLPGISPSQERAITLANENVGAWKPYIDKAAGGFPSVDIESYMNPYIESALDPAAQKVRDEATRKRISNQARAAQVGAFGGSRAAVEQGALDSSELETIGDLYKTGLSSAFDRASNLAIGDLDRSHSLGKTVGALGATDVAGLSGAGALERIPYEDAYRKFADTTKLYTGVVHGTAPAVTASTDPSKLTQTVGALGAYKSLKDLGIV